MRAIRAADTRLGELVRTLEQRGLLARTALCVVSDHGFVSHVASPDLPHALQRAGQRKGALVADGAVRAGSAALPAITTQLPKEAWIGAVFGAPRADDAGVLGALPGTFSARLLRWAHPRAGDLLVLCQWLDQPGPHELRGVGVGIGPGGHGNASPFEVHATLVLAGPRVRAGVRSGVPSANTDIAPTVCHLLGIPVPGWMEGRVLEELFADGPHPWAVPVETARTVDTTDTFVVQTTTMTARDGRKFRYVDLAGRVR
jgi:arylsulfatase A-like enzyme